MTVFAVAMAFVGVSACGSSEGRGSGEGDSEDLTTLNVAIAPYQEAFSLYVGIEKGFFRDLGLELNLSSMDSNTSSEALAAGSVDFANVCDVDLLVSYQQNPEIRFTNPTHIFIGSALLAREDSNLKTFEDFMAEGASEDEAVRAVGAQLAGLTAIATHNSDQELAIHTAAAKGGVDPSDISFIDLSSSDGLAAFLRGEADVFSGGLPQRAAAVERGAKVLISGTQLAPEGTVLCGFATSSNFLEDHEDLVLKFQDGWYRTMQEVEANPDESFETISSELQTRTGVEISVEDMANLWNNLELFPSTDEKMSAYLLDPESPYYWRDRYEYATDFYRDAGTISAEIDLEELYAYPTVHEAYVSEYGG